MQTLLAALQVALGLGFVIFVHELGHFAVAKWCGVRCDRFFVGFDVPLGSLLNDFLRQFAPSAFPEGGEVKPLGFSIPRTIGPTVTVGETTYGIGILPLGGYVKMFGQEDNVAALAEEFEKAKALEGSPDAKPVTGPGGKTVWIDKRSYLAKSVPQRMAIISAGVVMNVIFAFVFAWFAFGFGVPETPAVVGGTLSGGPAWQAGLRTGDRLLRINGIENPTYKQLRESVILGDLSQGLECVVERAGGTEETLTLRPEVIGPAPQVGVIASSGLRLDGEDAVGKNTPAGAAGDAGFRPGDQIVALDGDPVDSFADLAAALETRSDETIEYTVLRGGAPAADDPFGPATGGQRVSFSIEPNRMERLGIVPTLGPVTAVEQGSPAAAAGLVAGDQPLSLDGTAIGTAPDADAAIDPIDLEALLRAAASRGEAVRLTYRRGESVLEAELTPRVVTWQSRPLAENSPLALDSIGLACEVRAEVAAVVAGSPAAEAGVLVGDRIASATLLNPKGEAEGQPLPLGQGQHNWPALVSIIQDLDPGSKVKLAVQTPGTGDAPGTTRMVAIEPRSVDGAFTPTRGVRLTELRTLRRASSLGERTSLAWEETRGALLSVVRFLQKIGRQVSVKALGGPLTIAQVAGQAAFDGFGALLISLTMLSANLAVLNFLPIPVLDGGHMVFLLYEGLTGRPPSEKFLVWMQGAGLLFLLGLMAFVFWLDISRLLGIAV